jgi:hypothetical protein
MSMQTITTAVENEDELLTVIDELRNFERAHKLTSRFNFFEAVNMTRQETKHSRFLSFLLNPQESHRLNDKFLRIVLIAAASEHPCSPVSRLDFSIRDLSDAIVYCERDHFDISVQIPSLKLLFVIENKIDSGEGVDQLRRYRELAVKRYGDYKFMGCFLTPDGYSGEDDQWGALSYALIARELQRMVEESSLADEVGMAIRQYISLIERKIVVSDAMVEACRQIYKNHKTALDLIFDHGQVSELEAAFDMLISDNQACKTLEIKSNRSETLFFFDSNWLVEFRHFLVSDSNRWKIKFPVHYWFTAKPKKLYLRLEVGPFLEGSGANRAAFVQTLRSELGTKENANGGSTYIRIKTISRTISEDRTSEDLKEAMEDLWKSMDADRVNAALKKAIASAK